MSQLHSTKQREKKSEVTIFDQIMPRNLENKGHNITLTDKQIEYPVRDIYRSLRGQTAQINFFVEIMPIVGYIERVKLQSIDYKFPSEYVGKVINYRNVYWKMQF